MEQNKFEARLLRSQITRREITRDSYADAADWQLRTYRMQYDRGVKQSATMQLNKAAEQLEKLLAE
jgi:hypothetical protein